MRSSAHSEPSGAAAHLVSAIERQRGRLWALCYRMTGNRADADDLAQEAVTGAIERADQATADDPTGWVLRIATRVCLGFLRRRKVQRRLSELVDPIDTAGWKPDPRQRAADHELLLRED